MSAAVLNALSVLGIVVAWRFLPGQRINMSRTAGVGPDRHAFYPATNF